MIDHKHNASRRRMLRTGLGVSALAMGMGAAGILAPATNLISPARADAGLWQVIQSSGFGPAYWGANTPPPPTVSGTATYFATHALAVAAKQQMMQQDVQLASAYNEYGINPALLPLNTYAVNEVFGWPSGQGDTTTPSRSAQGGMILYVGPPADKSEWVTLLVSVVAVGGLWAGMEWILSSAAAGVFVIIGFAVGLGIATIVGALYGLYVLAGIILDSNFGTVINVDPSNVYVAPYGDHFNYI